MKSVDYHNRRRSRYGLKVTMRSISETLYYRINLEKIYLNAWLNDHKTSDLNITNNGSKSKVYAKELELIVEIYKFSKNLLPQKAEIN